MKNCFVVGMRHCIFRKYSGTERNEMVLLPFFSFLVKKDPPMNKKIVSFLLALFFLCTVISCDIADTETTTNHDSNALTGTWTSPYGDEFQITDSQLTSLYDGNISYKGDSLIIVESDSASGYLYIKYTMAPYGTVGNWYALSYKELTDTSVKLSSAYKVGGMGDTGTLEEAKTEFTVENGYFALYGEYVKK